MEDFLSRQTATVWDDFASEDEGSPAEVHSPSSDVPCDEFSRYALTASSQFDAFDIMVRQQQEQRKADQQLAKANWIREMQAETTRFLPPHFRLPALISEGFRYEAEHIRKALIPTQQKSALLHDTKRAYTCILREVKRATKESMPPIVGGVQKMSAEEHRQDVANQGIQAYASMLPYSCGVCGGITLPQNGPLVDPIPTDLQLRPGEQFSVAPRGTEQGQSGQYIPISLGAPHGKAEKIASLRRRQLAKLTFRKTKAQTRTPMFARTRTDAYRQALPLLPMIPN